MPSGTYTPDGGSRVPQQNYSITPPTPGASPTPSSGGNSYGMQLLNQLKALRGQLDAGQIPVTQYLDQGKQLAQQIFAEQLRLGGGGSNAAKQGDDLRNAFQSANTGFTQSPTNDPTTAIGINLPDKYQQDIRESLIPSNITGDQRKQLIDSIPNDIQYGSDQWKIEQEAIRQKVQAQQAADQASTLRKQNLSTLSDVLSKQADQAYDANSPKILEDLNARGLLGGSGVGKALAQEKTRQQQLVDSMLAQQGVSNSNLDANAIQGIQDDYAAMEQAGLSRNFSTADNSTAFNQALALAKLSQPQSQGSSKGGQASAAAAGSILPAIATYLA